MSISRATASRLGVSNNTLSGKSTRNEALALETTCVAIREWPPSVKKLSCTPIFATDSTSPQIAASVVSVGVRGATWATSSETISGAGKALRSILPLGVNGSRSSCTNAEGTMYSGNCFLRCCFNAPAIGAAACALVFSLSSAGSAASALAPSIQSIRQAISLTPAAVNFCTIGAQLSGVPISEAVFE